MRIGGRQRRAVYGEPRSFIQWFPLDRLSLQKTKSRRDVAGGNLLVHEHSISWNLRLSSQFGFVLSNKAWIGFSKFLRTPMRPFPVSFSSMGRFSVESRLRLACKSTTVDTVTELRRWTRAYFLGTNGGPSTLEALVYELPLGMTFRKVVLWHPGKKIQLRKMNEPEIWCENACLKW